MFTEQDKNVPVSAGAVHDVAIEGIAREGDGIARIQGFVICENSLLQPLLSRNKKNKS